MSQRCQGDSQKWDLPGWRIEQRFANDVLIGNWYEERKKFEKNRFNHNSTNRIDFKPFPGHRPDVTIRRKGPFKHEGLPKKMILTHHDDAYYDNMITWYDEDYNKRPRTGVNHLPPVRKWDSNTLEWLPERSDHPIVGDATNWGLRKTKQQEWKEQEKGMLINEGSFNTVYRTSYNPTNASALVMCRRANPRPNSTSINPVNKVMANWHMRDRKFMTRPEDYPQPRHCVCDPNLENGQ